MNDQAPNFVASQQIQLAAIHGSMAIFGAVVHALRAHRDGKSKGWVDLVVLTIMSSFSGVIFALIAVQFFQNTYITLAFTGAGGFLGVEGLTYMAVRLREVLTSTLSGGKKL